MLISYLHLAQTFSDNNIGFPDYDVTITDFSSCEDHANHILHRHYGTLFQYLHCPAIIAPLLSLEI